ncbi:MAG: DUF883 family protein [Asticcacaulis sp.]|nr:DUF883 family protein [Asticcacaulis sp.]
MFSSATKSAAQFTETSAEHDLTSQVRHSADAALRTVKQLRDDASDYVHDAGDKVRQVADTARTRVKGAVDRTTGQIRGNPVPAALVALGIGAVLGFVFRSLRRA